MASLTRHDNSILKALFDPEASPSGAVHIDARCQSLPYLPEAHFADIRAREQLIVQSLSVSHPSHDAVQAAIDNLTNLIDEHQSYASAYVNRAQTLRLLLPTDGIFTAQYSEESMQLLQDLGQGIGLVTPASPHHPVSTHQSFVLAAAHTHRGFLLLRAADQVRKGISLHGVGEALSGASAEQIEELASRDFFSGGRYGNKTAQQMSVKTNPYAKMCGAIVKEALCKEVDEARGIMELELGS